MNFDEMEYIPLKGMKMAKVNEQACPFDPDCDGTRPECRDDEGDHDE